MGEPAGIGGELLLKAWRARRADPRAAFFAVDDPGRLAALSRRLGLDVPVRTIARPQDAVSVFAEALPVLAEPLPGPAVDGKPSPATAAAVIRSIERAVACALSGAAGAIVTAPIQKKALQDSGFVHPGHTEFLAELAGRAAGRTVPVAMMLACAELRTVPVTIHVSLRRAVETLTPDAIVGAALLADAALRRDFAIARPRIAVAGLNPHAGEQGAMGDEERTIVAPAVARLAAAGLDVSGPWPPDTMFHAAARARYDVAICMYHDQALIPVKTVDFAGGVNVTLGLPFVRTSPDHGTALDIAGQGKADPASFLAALDMACDLARRRLAASGA